MATRASPSLLEHLKDTVAGIVDPLPGVDVKRMFGCDAWLVNGSLFALLMGYGRVVVKLPASGAQGLGLEGAEPWVYGKKSPTNWVVLPEEFNDDVDPLREWIRRAYAEVLTDPPKTTKRASTKKTAAKTSAKKKSATKKPS